jgi:hypothetical protein
LNCKVLNFEKPKWPGLTRFLGVFSSRSFFLRLKVIKFNIPYTTHKGLIKNKIMKNKKCVLSCLIILLTGVIYFSGQAQQKNDNHRANFSGEWKSKESISMGGNIVCSYGEGDRMLSKTMKIAERADFLTIEIPNSSPDAALSKSREKLPFDGKESQINHGRERGKKFTVKLSADGQTMTINSIVYLITPTPNNTNVQEQAFVYVNEVWKLSNDGKSITVQANAKSTLFEEERSWETVFDKTN